MPEAVGPVVNVLVLLLVLLPVFVAASGSRTARENGRKRQSAVAKLAYTYTLLTVPLALLVAVFALIQGIIPIAAIALVLAIVAILVARWQRQRSKHPE